MSGVWKLRFAVSIIELAWLFSGHASAQQGGTPTTDVKPAQANSPNTDQGRANHAGSQMGQAGGSPAMNGQRGQERTTNYEPGQDRTGQGQDQSNGQAQGQESNVDRDLAACLLTSNKGEVELGKLAVDRATDPEVKEFAQKMVKDHTAQVEKLQQVVGSQEPNDQRAQIDRKIDERCNEMLKKELTEKSGKEFDAAYVGSQIAGHIHMAAALEVISSQTSGQLRDLAREAQPTVEQHLMHAKKLMGQLDKANGNRSQASKERTETER
jgi:putative membrane protein